MLKWLNTLKNNAETCLSFCFTEKTGQIRMTVTNRPGSFISHAMNMINLQTDNPEHFTVFIRNFGPPLQWPYTIVCFRPKSSPEFFDRTFTNFMLTCYPPEKCSINGTYKNHRKGPESEIRNIIKSTNLQDFWGSKADNFPGF